MNEIEEKFYKTFGIEKIVIKGCYEYYTDVEGIDIWEENDCKNKDCTKCPKDKTVKKYPPITDRILLELICIASCYTDFRGSKTIDDLKEKTLTSLISDAEILERRKAVQSLFTEGEE